MLAAEAVELQVLPDPEEREAVELELFLAPVLLELLTLVVEVVEVVLLDQEQVVLAALAL
jgi:hypothetical protein